MTSLGTGRSLLAVLGLSRGFPGVAGGSPAAVELPYDCQKWLAHAADMWTEGKQIWCCANEGLGCTDEEKPLEFDCDVGYSLPGPMWSADKTAWCCERRHAGCSGSEGEAEKPASRAAALAAEGVFGEGDAAAAADAAAERFGGGAAGQGLGSGGRGGEFLTAGAAAGERGDTVEREEEEEVFDCSQWHLITTERQERWCCEHGKIPCRDTFAGLEFDCQAELQEQWSTPKKEWCCEHERLGCARTTTSTTPVPYDCLAGLDGWRSRWSKAKQAWCCEFERAGCPEPTRTPKVFHACSSEFLGWTSAWTQDRRDWCCKHRGVGCRTTTTASPTTATATSTTSKYDCALRVADNVRKWSEDQQAWCCKHWRIGCTTTSTTTHPKECYRLGSVYEPRETEDTPMTIEATVEDCQRRCLGVTGCMHFSYWSVGKSCYIQGASALEMDGAAGFVSGPPECLAPTSTTTATSTTSTSSTPTTTTLTSTTPTSTTKLTSSTSRTRTSTATSSTKSTSTTRSASTRAGSASAANASEGAEQMSASAHPTKSSHGRTTTSEPASSTTSSPAPVRPASSQRPAPREPPASPVPSTTMWIMQDTPLLGFPSLQGKFQGPGGGGLVQRALRGLPSTLVCTAAVVAAAACAALAFGTCRHASRWSALAAAEAATAEATAAGRPPRRLSGAALGLAAAAGRLLPRGSPPPSAREYQMLGLTSNSADALVDDDAHTALE